MTDDISFLSATEIATAIRAKKLSPVEVAGALLQRIERLNPKVNAYLTVTADIAIEAAKAAEATVLRGEGTSPLIGVPISIKDLIWVKDVPTTYGSLIYRDYVPPEDAAAVQRVRAAVAVILGKTNTPEFGIVGISENRLGEPCRNPWDAGRTPGGSSAGAAAALAAGLGPLALGSDDGGSVRIPAAFCGVFGFKPTFGLVPTFGSLPGADTLTHVGVMARTVEDAALLLEVVAGHDPRDPWSLSEEPPRMLHTLPTGIKGLRVAWSADLGFAAVNPEIRTIAESAAQRFIELGCTVEEADPEIEDPLGSGLLSHIDRPERAARHARDLDEHADLLCDYTKGALQFGRDVSGVQLVEAMWRRVALRQAVGRFFQRFDLLLTPTVAVPAYPIGREPEEIAGREIPPFGWSPFTAPFNLTGHPAASVPCGWTKEGMPVGLQIIGRVNGDATVLRAAAAFEQLQPWRHRHPPANQLA